MHDVIALRLKVVLQKFGEGRFVFDDDDLGGHDVGLRFLRFFAH
jgi:hypothetical protein